MKAKDSLPCVGGRKCFHSRWRLLHNACGKAPSCLAPHHLFLVSKPQVLVGTSRGREGRELKTTVSLARIDPTAQNGLVLAER
jgi:hypothetical protein